MEKFGTWSFQVSYNFRRIILNLNHCARAAGMDHWALGYRNPPEVECFWHEIIYFGFLTFWVCLKKPSFEPDLSGKSVLYISNKPSFLIGTEKVSWHKYFIFRNETYMYPVLIKSKQIKLSSYFVLKSESKISSEKKIKLYF